MARSNWTIVTSNLVIRDFEVGDTSAKYIAGLNDKEHMRFSSQRFLTHTIETSREYVRSFEKSPHFLLALELQEASRPVIGSITAYFNEDLSSADLGIFLTGDTAGKGLGKEAWCAVTEQFATQSEILSVTAGTSRSNLSMQALLAAAKFGLAAIDESTLSTACGVEDALRFRRDFHRQPLMSPMGRPA